MSLAHVAVSQRFPYPRVCGYILPPIFIGFGCLVQRVCEVFASRWLTGLAWAGCSLATLILLAVGSWGSAQDPAFAELAAAVSKADVPSGAVYPVYGQGVSDSLELYLPSDWLAAGDRLPLGDDAAVCVVGRAGPVKGDTGIPRTGQERPGRGTRTISGGTAPGEMRSRWTSGATGRRRWSSGIPSSVPSPSTGGR